MALKASIVFAAILEDEHVGQTLLYQQYVNGM
jgi:hypothetical protein